MIGNVIEVYKWDAERTAEQVNIYATLGASRHALPGRAPTHRMEFFVGLKPEQDGIAKPLAMAALDPVLHGTELDHGHAITYPESLWPGTDMHSLLVLRPVEEVISTFVSLEGLHIVFMQMIPIHASEMQFLRERHPDALLKLWQSANVAFWNPNRRPEPAPR